MNATYSQVIAAMTVYNPNVIDSLNNRMNALVSQEPKRKSKQYKITV